MKSVIYKKNGNKMNKEMLQVQKNCDWKIIITMIITIVIEITTITLIAKIMTIIVVTTMIITLMTIVAIMTSTTVITTIETRINIILDTRIQKGTTQNKEKLGTMKEMTNMKVETKSHGIRK